MSKKIKIILLISLIPIIILVILAILGLYWINSQAPDLSQFEYLKEPQISTKADQKMIVVKATGVPEENGAKTIGKIYKIFYQLPGLTNEDKKVAPRGRWGRDYDPQSLELTGEYGLPVPEIVASLPEDSEGVELVTWKYGEVAEILHVGSYKKEALTINKLKQFIEDNGYKISGEHEEEYIKGPIMFWKGNPEKYYTIIRYNVKKNK